jgi:hypothetical protein
MAQREGEHRPSALCARSSYRGQGGKVEAVVIPPANDGSDQGADDFIVAHGIGQFRELKRIKLRHDGLGQFRPWYDSWKKKKEEENKQRAIAGVEKQISDEELRALAQSVIDAPDALELYRQEYRNLGYGGDLTPVMIVTLAITTRLLKMRRGAMPTHTGVIGPPSIGKSYTIQTALCVLPKEAFHTVDAGSPRTLIYDAAPLKHRVLCFGESDSLPAGEDNPAASAVRNLCQDHYLHYMVTVKDPETGHFVAREIVKEGPAVLLTTAVRFIGGQLGTRLFLLEVPEDIKRLQQALMTQGNLEIKPAAEPSAALIAYQAMLQRLAPIDVIVPFAPILADEIAKSASAARILRDFQRLISLIKAVAILRIPQRSRDGDGRLIATIEDYGFVFDLVGDMYETTTTETSRSVRKLVEQVAEMDSAGIMPITFNAVAQRLGAHREQVKRWGNRAIRQAWLVNKEERKNYPAKLTTNGADPLPEFAGLPSALTIRDRCDSVTHDSAPIIGIAKNFANPETLPPVTPPVTVSQLSSHNCDSVTQPLTESERIVKTEDFHNASIGGSGSVTVSQPAHVKNDHGNDDQQPHEGKGVLDIAWEAIKTDHARRRRNADG